MMKRYMFVTIAPLAEKNSAMPELKGGRILPTWNGNLNDYLWEQLGLYGWRVVRCTFWQRTTPAVYFPGADLLLESSDEIPPQREASPSREAYNPHPK